MKFSAKNFLLILFAVALSSVGARAQLLSEDFESGSFPPTGWTNPGGFGFVQWSNYGVGGFGISNYSAFYDGFFWDGDADSMITPVFSQTSGESLIFEHAYAPYFDINGDIYSDLMIYYRLDGDDQWYLHETVPGTTLQTAPATDNFFIPSSSEWSTYVTYLPTDVVQLSFVADNFNSNSLYIDNIRVDFAPTGSDLAVLMVYAKGQFPRLHLTGDTIRARIKNEGGVNFTNVYVSLQMTGSNSYNDSVLIPSLAPGQSTVVEFNPYTPVMNGPTTVRVFVPDDDNNFNNEAFYEMNVKNGVLSYNDTTQNYCCGIGWFGEGYWLSRYNLSNPNSRIKGVRLRIVGAPASTNQIIRGVILNNAGVIVAKSDPYKVKPSDEGQTIDLKLSDPIPHRMSASNESFFVGVEQTSIASATGDDAYGIMGGQSESPSRPNAYFGAYGMNPVGQAPGSIFPWSDTRWGIEAVISPISTADVGISNLGLLHEQYFSSATIQPKGRVYNSASTGSATATVIRKITPGAYTSSQVVNIPANSSVEVTFANWTFTSGTAYTVRDSIVLAGDADLSDNVLSGPITPRVAKQLAVVWSKKEDRDSLVRAIIADGRFSSNFDTIPMHYTGSLRPFQYVFLNFRRDGNWTGAMRDSAKAFLDASTAANKKSLIFFHNRAADYYDPLASFFVSPADSIFLRQYLRSQFVAQDWQNGIPASGRKFKGKNFFSSVTQDSVYDEWNGGFNPDLIRPVNGSFAAFVPRSITGTGNDSSIAVAYAGPNYNTFFMTNQFHALRAKTGGLTDGPGRIYARIIDWINSTVTNTKVLDLTMLIEGFYDQNSNQMVRDTVRVYLRNTTNPYAIIDSAKGYLTSSGTQSFLFNNAVNGTNYYIQIKHRSALETWSKTGAMFTSNYMAYNFTTDSAKAFGNNMTKRGSRWVLYGGDVNRDGFVDVSDLSLIDNDVNGFLSGYVVTDLNGDDFVDVTDLAIADNNSTAFVGRITPNSEPEVLVLHGISLADENNSTGIRQEENKIDHGIYEKFRNIHSKSNGFRIVEMNGKRIAVPQ